MTRAARSRLVFIGLVTVLSLALAGLASFTIWNLAARNQSLNDRVVEQAHEISSLTDDLVASQENAQRLYDQLLALPGVEPEGENPTSVTPSTPGAPGKDGAPGRAPTAGEVRAGVLSVCTDFTVLCLGPTGATGKDGAAGQPGDSITGPAGPQGPAGESITGPTGPAGADGQSAFPFVFTFTLDGTTFTCTVTTSTDSVCAPAQPTEP